jgi:hypothetical protein
MEIWSSPNVDAEWGKGTMVPLISTFAPYRSAMVVSWLYRPGLLSTSARVVIGARVIRASHPRGSISQLPDLVQMRH